MTRAAFVAVAALSAFGCRGERIPQPIVAATGGDPVRGAALIYRYGCGACHSISGVRGAHGLVGPPLDTIGRRAFIAGRVPNTPDNIVRWIRDPHSVDPETAMPRLVADVQQARDIAAYLYSQR